MNGTAHKQKPDIDNMLKALLDACYKDDSVVSSVTLVKKWSYKGFIEVEY